MDVFEKSLSKLKTYEKTGVLSISFYFTPYLICFALLIVEVAFFLLIDSLLWFSIFNIIVFSFLSYLLTDFMLSYINYQSEILIRAKENHSVRADIIGNNEMSEFLIQFNKLLDSYSNMGSQMGKTVDKLSQLATDIYNQASENAEISSTQSSSIAQTTATIKELATSAEKIVEETRTVVNLAEETQLSAQKGTNAIVRMLEKMSEIQQENQRRIQEIVVLGKKAQEIEKVMDIINAIASNTKIIAFNAAIEAASSGEEGKRFGTVANEIRKLANTVSNSTNDIRDKIKEIQKTTNELVIVSEEETKKIQGGVETAETMVKELTEILEKADKTLDWVKQISLATQQQLTASDQVAVVLHDITDGVKRFSGAVNLSKEASIELKQLATSLKQVI